MRVLELVFWGSFGFIFYTYIGYPVVLQFWSFFRSKKVFKKYIYPQISVIIAALNEEKNIKARLENILHQKYPEGKMEVIVVSDGSSDRTEEIVKSFEKENVKLYSFETRKGKAEALNYGIPKAKGEIILFADARQIFKSDAIKELVANFNDPTVGAVSGELFLAPDGEGDINESMGMYWKYEKWIRNNESKINSAIGVTGAIYAIRKNLYDPIPPETILDDVLIPMRIALKGFRVILDDAAKAYDKIIIKSEKELKRKSRTLMGNFQLIFLLPEALSIKKNRLFVNYISHKLMRLLVPYHLLAMFIVNFLILVIIVKKIYILMISLQLSFYLLALAGYLFRNKQKILRYFTLPYTVVMLNYAAILGFVNFIRKNNNIWIKG